MIKPTLKIGAYRHAMSTGLAEFPLRLEWSRRDGIYYWAMARGGEFHRWLLTESVPARLPMRFRRQILSKP